MSSSKSTNKSSSTTSSKSTGSRPTTSTVRSAPPKPAPAPAPKPRNVDKVDFGKPKPQSVIYERPAPQLIPRREPEPKKPTPKLSVAEQEHKKKVESEAHKQIAAENKVEANKNKLNGGPISILSAASLVTSSVLPVSIPLGLGAVALSQHNDARHDAGEYTLAEKKAYDDYLYPKHHGYMSYDDAKRKEFAKENQAEIDQVKKEIKKEEEEEDQGS